MVILSPKNGPILPYPEPRFCSVKPKATFAQAGQICMEMSRVTVDNMTMYTIYKNISGVSIIINPPFDHIV